MAAATLVSVDAATAGAAPKAPKVKAARDLPALASDAAPKAPLDVPAGLNAPSPAPDGSLTGALPAAPGIQSAVAAPARPEQVDKAPPDPPAAKKAATGFVEGRSTEVVGERRADAKVFANPDGTRTEHVYARPQHFKDSKGDWQPIDDRAVPDGAGLRNAAGPVDARPQR